MIGWKQLAEDLGLLHAGGESGGTVVASAALEKILGDAGIQSAVDAALGWEPGSELAVSVLEYIHSYQGLILAYRAYKAAVRTEDAQRAVWLIKRICRPEARDWIEEFLRDDAVSGVGIDVLDQLLWTETVMPDAVQHLLDLAVTHKDADVQATAANIQGYLTRRSEE